MKQIRTGKQRQRRQGAAHRAPAVCLSLLIAAAAVGSFLLPEAGRAESEGTSLSVEAETGTLLGGAKIVRQGETAAVNGLANDGDGVQMEIEVLQAGFYDVAVVSASSGGYKENYLDVDGERIGSFVTDSTSYADSVLPYVYFGAGVHELTITKFWGWITIDKVVLSPAAALPADLYDVKPVLVNKNADENTRRLMAYLCDCYGKYVISGQYCDKGMLGTENAAIYRETERYPAILGLDLIEYSPSRAERGSTSIAVENAINYWNKGGIVTLCWHWNAPTPYLTGQWYSGFYTEHTNIDIRKIMDGDDPAGYDLLMQDIDAIAQQLLRLQEAGVPVLWRPLHEASGGWFWWGAKGSEPYIQLYRLLYDKLTNEYGLNNLIWVWNGQDAAWYPGDEYVDIIGEDIYPGEQVYTSQAPRFLQAMTYTGQRKMIVLSENGCLPDPDLLFRDDTVWGYTGTWSGEFVLKNSAFARVSEKYTDLEMLKKFYQHEKVITRDELPDLKTYPLPQEDASLGQ